MLRLEPRQAAPYWLVISVPIGAVIITLILVSIVYAIAGYSPVEVLKVYFVYPIADLYGVGELFVKATPLMLCALGLMFCFRAGIWNIGAEGQLTVGAITGSIVALSLAEAPMLVVLPLSLIGGMLGGMVWALIPATLLSKFRANEILTSLMLVYIAQLLLSALVHGPLRDPDGLNFPHSAVISDTATIPVILDGTRMHLGTVIALLLLPVVHILRNYHITGYATKVMGASSEAAVYGGFEAKKVIYGVFLTSGALAGLAGVLEVIGPIGRLTTSVSPGYGFTAIIIAFLGRMHPIGIVFASLLMALSFLGGELAQILLKVPSAVTGVFQGLLLFVLLGCDLLVRYQIKRPIKESEKESIPSVQNA